MTEQQAAMRQMIEVLEENHHLIEEYERPEYLAHYDRVISAGRQALEQQPADASKQFHEWAVAEHAKLRKKNGGKA